MVTVEDDVMVVIPHGISSWLTDTQSSPKSSRSHQSDPSHPRAQAADFSEEARFAPPSLSFSRGWLRQKVSKWRRHPFERIYPLPPQMAAAEMRDCLLPASIDVCCASLMGRSSALGSLK
jgi:hypothetical protein